MILLSEFADEVEGCTYKGRKAIHLEGGAFAVKDTKGRWYIREGSKMDSAVEVYQTWLVGSIEEGLALFELFSGMWSPGKLELLTSSTPYMAGQLKVLAELLSGMDSTDRVLFIRKGLDENESLWERNPIPVYRTLKARVLAEGLGHGEVYSVYKDNESWVFDTEKDGMVCYHSDVAGADCCSLYVECDPVTTGTDDPIAAIQSLT